jgi:transcriptional regulator of acetoin/glycerol metabolism
MLRAWPGNLGELRAALLHAVGVATVAKRELVRMEDLPEGAGIPPGTSSAETAVERKSQPGPIDKPALLEALQRANGVVNIAARALGMHRTQLCQLLDEHGIEHQQ